MCMYAVMLCPLKIEKLGDYIDSCKSLHTTGDYKQTYILPPSNNSLGSILLQLFHVDKHPVSSVKYQ